MTDTDVLAAPCEADRDEIDRLTSALGDAKAERDAALDDLRREVRLVNTILGRFTDHSEIHNVPETRTEWVPNEVIAEWRAIHAVSAAGAL
jgi:hypothetical protein